MWMHLWQDVDGGHKLCGGLNVSDQGKRTIMEAFDALSLEIHDIYPVSCMQRTSRETDAPCTNPYMHD